MGFLDSLFGGGDPYASARRDYNSQLGAWDAAFNQAYSPEAYLNQLGQLNQDVDTQFNNLRAAGVGQSANAGFRESPTYALSQAQFGAKAASDLRRRILAAKLAALGQRAQMALARPQDRVSTGIIPSIAGIAGQYIGMRDAWKSHDKKNDGSGQETSNSQTSTSPVGGFSTSPGLPYQSVKQPMANYWNNGPDQTFTPRTQRHYSLGYYGR